MDSYFLPFTAMLDAAQKVIEKYEELEKIIENVKEYNVQKIIFHPSQAIYIADIDLEMLSYKKMLELEKLLLC